MFLISCSDKELEFGTYHLRSQNWQTMVCDDHTVMLLLEDIFAMSTLLNFEFYILDLRECNRFIVSAWAACKATWLEQRLYYLCSYAPVH